MGLSEEIMGIIKKSESNPREIVEVSRGVTVKYHPAQGVLCAGLYHLRFEQDNQKVEAFIQLSGGLQGAHYIGSTDMIKNQTAYEMIEKILSRD